MVRLYGQGPYKAVLVHGGPGAIGSLKGFAKELNDRTNIGVVEAIQSKYSIDELIEELHNENQGHCPNKVTLIGHSWGAWLVALYSAKHPEQVDSTILVGSGPLEDKYVSEIGLRRMQNLSEEDGALFQRLGNKQATDEDMKRIPVLFEKSDNYLKSNLFIIQGSDDPHPAKGVIQPLEENGVECETYILEKCGHSPFMEKYAKEKFYEILFRIIVKKQA